MLQILIWLVAVLVVCVGLLTLQVAACANLPESKSGNAQLVGILTISLAVAGAGFCVWMANEQANGMSSLGGF